MLIFLYIWLKSSSFNFFLENGTDKRPKKYSNIPTCVSTAVQLLAISMGYLHSEFKYHFWI